MSDTQPKRLWYPVDLMDEALPTGLPSAEAWLDPHMQLQLDECEKSYILGYKPGDRIEFMWIEDRGMIELAINPDGTLNRPMRCVGTPDMFGAEPWQETDEIPSDANAFWDEDSETFADSAEEFAQMYAEAYSLGKIMHVSVHASHQSRAVHYELGPDGRSLTEIPTLKQEATAC